MIVKAFCVALLNIACQFATYLLLRPQVGPGLMVVFLLSLILLMLSGYAAFATTLPRNRPYRNPVLLKKAGRQMRRGFLMGLMLAMAAGVAQVLLLDTPQTLERVALSMVAYVLLWSAVTACAEEIVFRGIVMGALVGLLPKPFKVLPAILLQALLCAYVHMRGTHIDVVAVSSFLLAVLLATMAIRKRALWMPIGCHCAYEAVMAMMAGLHQKQLPEYPGLLQLNGNYPLASTAGLAIAATVAMVFMFVRRRSRSNDIFRPASHYDEETTLLMLYFSADKK